MLKRNNPFIIRDNIIPIKDYSFQKQQGDSFLFTDTNEKINSFLSHNKIKIIFSVCLFIFLLIISRLFWLQIIKGNEYNLIAKGNRIRQRIIPAERGIIYDRFGTPLVSNIANYNLYFIPADLPVNKTYVVKQLAKILEKPQEEINTILTSVNSNSYQPVLVTNNLRHEQLIALKTIENKLPGIELNVEPQRKYIESSGLAHLLGYVGKINQEELKDKSNKHYRFNDYIGKNGIELFYEDYLKGKDGIQEVEVNASGKTQKILNKINPQIGQDIILSIDLDLQKKITQVLSQALKKNSTAHGASAIALDPNSGEVLAMVSLPDYDNNYFSAGILSSAYNNYLKDKNKPLFNRSIAGNYPPGSTFKPLMALAALEEGIITKNKTFLSTGGLRIGKWFFPDWKYGGHGRTNVIKAIAESVNTFFYYIGGGYSNFTGLGVDKIVSYAKKLYLSRKLGIDLPGEATGFLPTREWKEKVKGEPWYIGDTYHLSIGQGDILVTPLQVASYTAAIANGGILYRPHLLKIIIDSNSSKDYITPNYILAKNIASKDNIDIVRQGLRSAVLKGSARSLQYLPVASAGKTGTAQVGGQNNFHAWFTGFAPYKSPKIVLTILVENGGEGSSVSVPVFKEIIDWYFKEN